MKNFKHDSARRTGTRVAALSMALLLAACGGGGGNPGAVGGGTGSGGTGGTGGTTPVAAAKTVLQVFDGSGAETTSIAGGQTATIKATVTLASGKPAANALVTFTAGSSGMVVFDPENGAVTTDATGLAVMKVR